MNCTGCETEIGEFDSYNGRCGNCHAIHLQASATGKTAEQVRDARTAAAQKRDYGIESERRKATARKVMILTTETAHNLAVNKRLGIVSAEVVVGMNIFKDMLTGVRNIVGGRTGNVQNALRDMRRQALSELKQEATQLGADAVVGIDLDYNEIGATGSTMLMLVVNGTAVTLQTDDD